MSLVAPIWPDRGRRGWSLTVLSVLLVPALAGCQSWSLSAPQITSTPVATPIVVNISSPTLSPSPTPSPAHVIEDSARVEAARAAIRRTAEAFPGRCAIVLVDLDSQQRVEVSPQTSFESASLVKLVILAELFRQFETGNHQPQETLVLLDSHKRGGSGQLRQAPEGTAFSLGHLAEVMITESDNTATQMLTDLLGRETIEQGSHALGLKATTLQRDIFDFDAIPQGRDNTITASDAADFFVLLAREELPGATAMHEILERQKRRDMLGNGFPPDVRVAHKTGELQGVLHDAGIIYAPHGPFILACLSDQVSNLPAAKAAWAELAQTLLAIYSPTAAPAKVSPSPNISRSPN